MLIDFLNDYYKADLKNIHDVAGNQHLTGYSELYKTNLFIKITKSEEAFYAEQHVNQVYCSDIYLDSLIFEDRYIVALKDRKMEDLDVLEETVTRERAKKYGKMLANFHEELSGKVRVLRSPKKLSDAIKKRVHDLQNSPDKEEINEVYQKLKKLFLKADLEYEQIPKVVLHGDYSLRNIMRYKNQDILIDFERSHEGIAFEDFIKIFFNEVHDKKLRREFIKGYQSKKRLEIPQKELQSCLLFYIALEIYKFYETHPKESKFFGMAESMLNAIKNENVLLEI